MSCGSHLSGAGPQSVRIDPDFAVENNVAPWDGIDVLQACAVERKVGCGEQAGEFPGLPVDDAGEDERQTGAGLHLVTDIAGIDAVSVTMMDRAGQGMELLDLQQATPDPGMVAQEDTLLGVAGGRRLSSITGDVLALRQCCRNGMICRWHVREVR